VKGGHKTLEVHGTDSIEELRRKIEVNEGIPPEIQKIIFARRELADGSTLADNGIAPDSTLHLVLNMKG
jgi:ubiquitin C